MSNNSRVLNITTGAHPKQSQAKKKVAECEWGWVKDVGGSVRVLTNPERVIAWQQSERRRESLASAELPGLIFEPPKGKRQDFSLLRAAQDFVTCQL